MPLPQMMSLRFGLRASDSGFALDSNPDTPSNSSTA